MALINYKNMFLLHTIMALLFGVLILFITPVYEMLYGFDLSDSNALFHARYAGQFLLILGMYTFTLSKSTEAEVKKWGSISNLLASSIGLLLTLWVIIFSGWFTGTSLIVFIVTISPVYVLLIGGFGYLYFTKAYENE